MNAETNADFIARVRKVCEEAVDGPWKVLQLGPSCYEQWQVTPPGEDGWTRAMYLNAERGPEARFIAESRTALPEALDRLEKAEARIAELEEALADTI